MINKQQQCSTLVMALAIITATMLVSTVIVETLDLFDDAEAKKTKSKKHGHGSPGSGEGGGHGSPGGNGGSPDDP